jgi:hypothetical protein
LAGFNKIEFDQIIKDGLYLQRNLKNVVFKSDALDVKSAWIDMTNVPNPGRYYKRAAFVFDPAKNTCSQIIVGLVALHIVQKTDSRPQWIWSTFEQMDLVPPAHGVPMTLNDGSGVPLPPINPIKLPRPNLCTPPEEANVLRGSA